MNTLSLFFLPVPLWWPAAVALSAVLVVAAMLWARKRLVPATTLLFSAFALLWWLFGFVLALWPLHGLDEFAQWARASSYVTVPLWIGGIAWAAALLAVRLLRAARPS
ncbi:hypothetical protein [Comamonas odontotermitis]|uniref:hypothetical protein n=1 Tax=Comamonas odontotermitis TaxID=379895 RepID=UPI001CC52325|nr:hypothetical protein [Comamonas odontotermitis]UBB17414.1 hypothetical protein LAD35_01765 [Comamonas odontotermitis]